MTASTNRPAEQVAREELTKRQLPMMLLSNGGTSSMTPAPIVASPNDLPSPTQAAQQRFAVRGNAVVTGGAGTLGMAACVALLEHGLQGLSIFDVAPENCQAQLELLRTRFPGVPIEIHKVNVTDEVAVEAGVEEAARLLGSVDHLFCFVGIVGCVDAVDMKASHWRQIMDVNLNASFICAQAVARVMIRQGTRGTITFTASISAHRVNYPQPQAAYNVSKSALLMLKNCLAAEWARYGIRTNTISPGYMDTILNEGDGIAEARNMWCKANPSGRMGVPSELTGIVVLLASEASTYINGADIVVDGGGIVF